LKSSGDTDAAMDASTVFLQRLLFSSGYFGAVSNRQTGNLTHAGIRGREVRGRRHDVGEAVAASPETDDSPAGAC
jgi:hypothetical protein